MNEQQLKDIEAGCQIFSNYLAFDYRTEQMAVLDKLPHQIVAIFSGNQGGKCVTYQTLIDTKEGRVSIGELYERDKPFTVCAWNGKQKVYARAKSPFKKRGFHECYKIEMSDGRTIEAADHHRVLSSRGWISVEQLREFFDSQQVTSLELCPSVRALDGSRLMKKESGSQYHYLGGSCRYGVQPRLAGDTDEGAVPLQDETLKHNSGMYERGGLANKYADSLLIFLHRLASRGGVRHFLAHYVEF